VKATLFLKALVTSVGVEQVEGAEAPLLALQASYDWSRTKVIAGGKHQH